MESGCSQLPRERLTRYEIGSIRFLTLSCEPRPHFLAHPDARNAFGAELKRCDNTSVLLPAYVVMPDHVHLLLTPKPGTTVADALRDLIGQSLNPSGTSRTHPAKVD